MKILILTNFANGLYLFRKELLEAFLTDGHEIVVSVPPDENVKKLEDFPKTIDLENAAYSIVETPFERRGNNPIKDASLFITYLKMLKKVKPDVVLTYTIKPNLYGGLACRLLRVPYLVNVTGLGTAIENGGILGKVLVTFYKVAVGKAQRVFFQNSSNREYMLQYGVAKNNSDLLPGSGVNLAENCAEPYPAEEEGIRFLSVVRIMRDKGIEEYLQMAETMKKEFPEASFGLVGDYESETREQYEPLVKRLQEQGILTYYGYSNRVHEIMAKSHVIVHPSYHEGLSNVLLEAAACARPVLASNIHGCIETFEEGKSGYAFEPKSKESLTDAVRRMLQLSEAERRMMGQAGRNYVESHFDRNLIIRKYRKEFEILTDKKRK